MTTLWIRHKDCRQDTKFFPMRYDEEWQKSYPTFESFKENFIRGWGCSATDPTDLVGEPVEYVVQDAEPDSETKWLHAPEFESAYAIA